MMIVALLACLTGNFITHSLSGKDNHDGLVGECVFKKIV